MTGLKPAYYREHLNQIANVYDRAVGFITFFIGGERRFRKQVIGELGVKAGHRFLEICCGTGTLSLIAAENGAEVTGIDLAENMLRVAAEKAEKKGLKAVFEQHNAEDIKLADGSFDRILISFGLHELPLEAQKNTLREIKRLLKPGGQAMIVDYGPSYGLPGVVYRLLLRFTEEPTVRQFIKEDLIKMLHEAGFSSTSLTYRYFDTMRYLKFSP